MKKENKRLEKSDLFSDLVVCGFFVVVIIYDEEKVIYNYQLEGEIRGNFSRCIKLKVRDRLKLFIYIRLETLDRLEKGRSSSMQRDALNCFVFDQAYHQGKYCLYLIT